MPATDPKRTVGYANGFSRPLLDHGERIMTLIRALLCGLLTILLGGFPAYASAQSSDSRDEIIAILGTGDMGDSFGPRLAGLGYKVVYGSRNPESDRVKELIARTGANASAATSDVAARQADIVFLAIPWEPMEQVIKSLGPMKDKTIVDLSWPASELAEDGYWRMTTKPSGAEVIQGWIPDAMVVKAFGTIGSYVVDDPSLAGGPVSIPIASDHRSAKETVARIAAELGLDPVDAGPLRMAANIEAMMELYLVPHTQGREISWEFYFQRTNYWSCDPYSGGEDVETGLTPDQLSDLAEIPMTQPVPESCQKQR